jgi:hypothetical protein
VVDQIDKVHFRSMCRAYDKASVKTLGSWANNEGLDMNARMEAMKILFMYGHSKPVKKEKKEHSGNINLTMRMIHEGKPPGEK